MTTTIDTKYVRRGQGGQVHIAKEYYNENGELWLLAARCDGWGRSAGRRVTYTQATEATCKSCLRTI